MRRLVATRRAPHYPELAGEHGKSAAGVPDLVGALGTSGLPFLVQPETDYVLTVSPLSVEG